MRLNLLHDLLLRDHFFVSFFHSPWEHPHYPIFKISTYYTRSKIQGPTRKILWDIEMEQRRLPRQNPLQKIQRWRHSFSWCLQIVGRSCYCQLNEVEPCCQVTGTSFLGNAWGTPVAAREDMRSQHPATTRPSANRALAWINLECVSRSKKEGFKK